MSNWIFKGFESPISFWLVLILLAVACALSVWSYYHLRASKLQKLSLITLRVLAFGALAAVLLNPVIQRIGVEVVRNKILVLLDNSMSTGLSLGSYQGLASYRDATNVLLQIDTNHVELQLFRFDNTMLGLDVDSLKLDGRETDIAKALGTVSELERDARAVILFTDGQYTTGRDPRFVVDKMSQPLFVVGLGDSSRSRDLLVQDVIHPDIAYKDTTVPIEVMVANNGFGNSATNVTIQSAGRVLDSKSVTFRSERSVQSVSFEIPADDEGLRQYEVIIEPIDGEWTERNNRTRFSIDVLDNRLRVLLLSFEVHPDVKVVQSILESDESIFARSLTWIGGERFINGPMPSDSDTLDLVFLYGFPHSSIPQRVQDQVLTLLSRTSYVLAASPLFDPALAMRRLESSIPLSMPPVNTPFEVGIKLSSTSLEHPILNFEHPDYVRAPRLFGHIRNLRAAPGAEVLMTANFRGADVDAPILSVRTVGSRRTSVLNLFGYYVWNMNSNPVLRTGAQDLLRNLILWTASQPDDRRLVLSPTRKTFDSVEPAIISAFLKDESGIQVTDGSISLELKREGGETSTYSMNNDGLGKYSVNVGPLPEGLYEIEAVAMRGSREIDRRTGQFSVSENVVEFTNTHRNDVLLRDLAISSGGQYTSWDQASDLLKMLQSLDLEEPVEKQVAIDWYPYRRIGWFLLALAFLTCEWVLRKYLALP